MYFAFTRIPGESYCRRLRSLLYLCYVFRALINSLVLVFFLILFIQLSLLFTQQLINPLRPTQRVAYVAEEKDCRLQEQS